MAPTFAEQLARFRIHAESNLPLPVDVATWALQLLEDNISFDLKRLRRDQHLRRAGALIGGRVRPQAREILRIADRIERSWQYERFEWTYEARGVWDEIAAARQLFPMPGERQLRNILRTGQSGR